MKPARVAALMLLAFPLALSGFAKEATTAPLSPAPTAASAPTVPTAVPPARPVPRATRPGLDLSRSVVNVQVHRSRWDWSLPWRMQPVQGAMGSGFLIDGGRIITNAHVVADARQVLVRRSDEADPRVATVVMVGNDCDLAVLQVEDPTFLKGLTPLALGDLPRAGSRVVTWGFPLGGQDVSSTAGIVSRVESRGYVHSGTDQHLVVQTDAAINPGNSGGPVVQDGRVVGVAFQGYPGFDNMGFFIPTPVVRHFLDNIRDGKYDGFPDSGLVTASLLSPAYRKERGLSPGTSGVVVERVMAAGSADGHVKAGDVVVSVDGRAVANDGTIALGDARVTFEQIFDTKQVGDTVRLGLVRDGKPISVSVVARRITRLDSRRNQYGVAPRYVVYAGLVLMPLDTELLRTMGRPGPDRDLLWHHLYREAEKPETAEREVVVLTRILRHQTNSEIPWTGAQIVQKINGVELSGLADVPAAIAAGDGFVRLEFEGAGGIEVLDRRQADEAHDEILKQYAIARDRVL